MTACRICRFMLLAMLAWATAGPAQISVEDLQDFLHVETEEGQLPAPAPLNGAQVAIARVRYSGPGEWYFGESALPNFVRFVREQTTIDMADPAVVALTDAQLPRYAMLYLTGHGEIGLSDHEVRNLRRYLERGGFLFVNDNGPLPDDSLDGSIRHEMRRVFPETQFQELPADHPAYHCLYEIEEKPPRVHEHDPKRPPQGLAIFHAGRMVVYYAHNSDFASGWEDASVYNDPEHLRQAGLEMGVNLLLFALAQ
jgi:hypothetical protein